MASSDGFHIWLSHWNNTCITRIFQGAKQCSCKRLVQKSCFISHGCREGTRKRCDIGPRKRNCSETQMKCIRSCSLLTREEWWNQSARTHEQLTSPGVDETEFYQVPKLLNERSCFITNILIFFWLQNHFPLPSRCSFINCATSLNWRTWGY